MYVPSTPSTSRIAHLALVDYSVIFWSPEVKVDERAAYQITLTAPSRIYISSLPFTSIAIYIREDAVPIIVQHVDIEPSDNTAQEVRLGHLDYNAMPEDSPIVEANLRWRRGGSIVLTGSLSSAQPTTISVGPVYIHGITITHRSN